MLSSEAKTLVGHVVNLTYTNRSGREFTQTVEVWDVGFVPLYGPCLITEAGEVRLDRVCSWSYHAESKAA
ncbi:MAG: hypothetical protein MUC92_12050 [Fimbriimonadaceae bacterium]|nr:hypothetical protein [Fimbriimonadaceae bacterium]